MVHHRWLPICLFMLVATTTAAGAQPASPSKNQCFYINQLESWRAPDAKTIYIRVQLDNYYRLDLAGACPAIMWPGSHLITKTRGPDTVCSAVDWDLSVSEEPHGIPEPCIVKSMTRLSPREVAAIPRKFKP
ncbi:MAG: DUF6491 family protein [Rhizomicrobium sp.]